MATEKSPFKDKNFIGVVQRLLLFTIVVVAVGVIMANFRSDIKSENVKTVSTEMLLIQGKIKVLGEKSVATGDTNILKGHKVADHIDENPKIHEVIEKGIISQDEENFDKYYFLSKEEIDVLDVEATKMKDGEYMIVNYSTFEVIYTLGYVIDGNFYYKLSDIVRVEEERGDANDVINVQNEEATTEASAEQSTEQPTEQPAEQPAEG